MTDFFVKQIPLPLPRPIFPEEQPFSGNIDLLDYHPWIEIEKKGTELMKQQIQEYIISPLSQFYGYLDAVTIRDVNKEDMVISLIGLIVLAFLVAGVLNLCSWLYRIFRKR